MLGVEKDTKKFNFNKKIILALSFSLIFLSYYTILVFSNLDPGDKIEENTYILDCPIGGLETNEAISIIKEKYSDTLKNKNVPIKFEEKVKNLNLESLDAEINFEKTINDASDFGQKKGLLIKVFDYLKPKKTKKIFPLVVKYNEEKLYKFIENILSLKEKEPTEWSYWVENDDLIIKKGSIGARSNKEIFFENFKNKIGNLNFEEEEIVLNIVEPQPLCIEKLCKEMNSKPKNAFYKKVDSKIIVVPDKKCIHISNKELQELLASDKEIYRLKVHYETAEITESVLREKLFKDPLSSYSTKFNSLNTNRVTNIKISSAKCNGYEMLPQEVFSFNETVGLRSAEKGYKTSIEYAGDCPVFGIGGGICQTSSTIYSALLHANADLEILERKNHSLPVSYVPLGQDATVAQNLIDLKFKNKTKYPIKMNIEVSSGIMRVEFWGSNDDSATVEIKHIVKKVVPFYVVQEVDLSLKEGDVKVKREGKNGLIIESQKIIKKNDVVITEKLPESSYSKIDKIILVNPKKSFENVEPKKTKTKDKDKPSKNTAPEKKPQETPKTEMKPDEEIQTVVKPQDTKEENEEFIKKEKKEEKNEENQNLFPLKDSATEEKLVDKAQETDNLENIPKEDVEI